MWSPACRRRHAGLPIAVTDDVAGAREAAGRLFERYGQLTHNRRLLDLEDAQVRRMLP